MADETEAAEPEEIEEYEPTPLFLDEDQIVIPDWYAFSEAAGTPLLIKRTGVQLWLYWRTETGWEYDELKAEQRKPAKAQKDKLKVVK
jgi:hypothetical protein